MNGQNRRTEYDLKIIQVGFRGVNGEFSLLVHYHGAEIIMGEEEGEELVAACKGYESNPFIFGLDGDSIEVTGGGDRRRINILSGGKIQPIHPADRLELARKLLTEISHLRTHRMAWTSADRGVPPAFDLGFPSAS